MISLTRVGFRRKVISYLPGLQRRCRATQTFLFGVTKGLSSREAARGHATNVDSEMLSVTINRI